MSHLPDRSVKIAFLYHPNRCQGQPKSGFLVPWCFTHQYKNTTQFYFYAALLSSQNTNQQKGVINNEAITTLSNPSQLTHAGFYRIAACSADVNSQVEADSMKFTAYTTGDFYAFLLGHQVTTSGCRYGTLVITSPRFVGTFWIARIWEYKFVGWFKFTAA